MTTSVFGFLASGRAALLALAGLLEVPGVNHPRLRKNDQQANAVRAALMSKPQPISLA